MQLAEVHGGLVAGGVPDELATALLDEFVQTKRSYHLQDHRPTAVGAGRFAEAAVRILEHALHGRYTALSASAPKLTQQQLAKFENATSPHESLRIHIPRLLYAVYAVRNKRDAAHLNDGIDPNLQDATLVVGVLEWVLAEFVRLYHDVTPGRAQQIIADLVMREVPVVEEIAGQPVLSKDLPVGDQILVFLYRAGRDAGLDLGELQRHMRHGHRSNLTAAVKRLDGKRLVLLQDGRAHITSLGMRDLEARQLLRPA